jgi:nucleoside-diphosphate-sugar epimerase
MGSLVAVTGGTGFVGSHVVEALLAAGWRVRALVRRPASPGWLRGLNVELVEGDVRDPGPLPGLVDGASAVVHVAGKTAARSLEEYRAANAGGTANLVAACRASAPGAHFVLVSSQAAAGPARGGVPVKPSDPARPVSSYGISKREGEVAVERSGLSFTILRPSAIYGPRETAIRDLFVAASRGFAPVLAGGRARVQLVFVLDVAAAVGAALRRGGRGETLFAAHPEVLDYRQIAERLASLRTPPARLVPVPAAAVRAAGWLAGMASRLGAAPPVFSSEKAEEMLQDAWLCDVSETQAALGEPLRTGFAAGARQTWDWYRREGIISR